MVKLEQKRIGKVALIVMALLLCVGQFHVLHEKLLFHSHGPFQHHHHEHSGHPHSHEHNESIPSSDFTDCHEFVLTMRSGISTAALDLLVGSDLAFAMSSVAPRDVYPGRIPDPPDIPIEFTHHGLIESLSIAPNSPPALIL